MNRLVPLVIFLGLIATWFSQGGLAANVMISDGAKFVVNTSQYLSVSDQYFLVMQPDCALVLYNHSGRPVASSRNSTSSRLDLQGNCSLWLQADGNLVIFKLDNTTYLNQNRNQEIWNRGYFTASVEGDASTSLLLLGGDGSLRFYDYNIDITGTMNDFGQFESVNASAALAYKKFIPSDYQAWKPKASLDGFPYMPAEYFISPGQRLLALSSSFELRLGSDCNLVSSKLFLSGGDPVLLWASWTSRSFESSLQCQLTLQLNGVLQLHSTISSEVYWTSTTSGAGNSSVNWILRVDPDNGTLIISDITNTSNVLWTNEEGPKFISSTSAPVWPIVVGVVGGAFVLAMAALGLRLYLRENSLHPADKAFQVRLRASGGNSQAFSQAKIKRATNNFDTVLGRGGFGDVFYGKLPDGTEVAAKVLSAHSHQSKQEFYNEIELLSKVHHKYLVSLLGFCCTRTHQVLIYDFMGGGNLRQRLQAGESVVGNLFPDPLSWQQRTRIILQVAEGLEYLHHKCSPPIIHRDVKSTNILLTHNLVAKVADFGLSKLKTIGQEDATHVTTAVKGTPGYLDPEYHETGMLTEKSDVYAFGVVLLEILTGRHHMFIAQRVRDAWRLEQFDDMADPNVREDYDREELINLVELALRCARTSSLERPSMNEVVRRLHDVMLPPSEPSAMDSFEEYAHRIRSFELMALNSGNISSETVP